MAAKKKQAKQDQQNELVPIHKQPPKKKDNRQGKHRIGKKNPNAGRPRGSLNKANTALKTMLEDKFKFDSIKEMLQYYESHKLIMKELMTEMVGNGYNLTADQTKVFEHSSGKMYSVLAKMMSHTYPQLRTVDSGTSNTSPVMLNFSVPAAPAVTDETKKEAIDIPLVGNKGGIPTFSLGIDPNQAQ